MAARQAFRLTPSLPTTYRNPLHAANHPLFTHPLFHPPATDPLFTHPPPTQPAELELVAHVTELPPLAKPGRSENPVVLQEVVELCDACRQPAPTIKHSSWCAERAPLEAARDPGSSESILTRTNGEGQCELLEGLITNLFVVQGGCVRTAPDGVLPGHIRQLVLDACDPLGIPVSLEAPRLEEFDEWEEAFLTGTGKLVRPIDAVVVPELMATAAAWATTEGGGGVFRPLPAPASFEQSVTGRVWKQVLEMVGGRSEDVVASESLSYSIEAGEEAPDEEEDEEEEDDEGEEEDDEAGVLFSLSPPAVKTLRKEVDKRRKTKKLTIVTLAEDEGDAVVSHDGEPKCEVRVKVENQSRHATQRTQLIISNSPSLSTSVCIIFTSGGMGRG